MSTAQPLQLRRIADCWDYVRIPLNATERAERAGPVPYWGANRVQDYVDTALVDDDVVLLGEDGAPFFDKARDVAFRVNEPIWPNNHIHVLKARDGVDPRWLAYALNDVDYSLYVAGSTRDKLTQGAMMSIELQVPTTCGQRAIADFLDRETAQIDAFIAKNEQLIALLTERRAAVIARAVTRGIHANVELRTSGVEWIGAIPLLWEVRPLRWSARIRTGTTPSGDGVFDPHDGAPWFRPDDLDMTGAPSVATRWLTPEGASQGKPALPGSVLLCTIGTVGKSGWINEEAHFNQQLTAIKWPMDDSFLYWALVAARSAIESLAVGNTLPILNNAKLGDLRLPVPPVDEQRAIVASLESQVSRIDSSVEHAQRAIELARERRAALISAAVTGKIDVGVDA